MKELIVPLCVLFVLATLLLPIPAAFLDFMLVANILLALLLLISTLYVSEPIKLSALPSLLLLTTMYRLALNVSTTRRILSGADPGQMIEAFGTVVVQGNMIVGLVVFLVITLVQFIVIAKGSERVAEVAARFTLDAMPGKQMSIDADMRAGIIDVSEARKKRDDLQLESRFYGALDGSMKFVKGDAVAGIVITGINLLGGSIMGLVVFDLELSSCISKFSLYTVGDGLLSQIPALLNSLAAGMIVTRVTGAGQTTTLALDLLQQIGQVRTVKILIACLAVGMSFAPGMPAIPFWTLAGVLVLSSISNADPRQQKTVPAAGFKVSVPELLEIKLQMDAVTALADTTAITQTIDDWRQATFETRGLLIPAPALKVEPDLDCPLQVVVRGVPHRQLLTEAGEGGVLVALQETLQGVIERSAVDLVDDVMTRRLLDQYEEVAPEQVAYVVPELASVTSITLVLRDLVREQISIRSFDVIMQAIAESAKRCPIEGDLLTAVRQALRRQICDQYGLYTRDTPVHQLDPAFDIRIMQCRSSGALLEEEGISSLLDDLRQLPVKSIIACSAGSRGFMRDLVHMHGLAHHCLALDELSPDASWKFAGTIAAARQAAVRQTAAEEVCS